MFVKKSFSYAFKGLTLSGLILAMPLNEGCRIMNGTRMVDGAKAQEKIKPPVVDADKQVARIKNLLPEFIRANLDLMHQLVRQDRGYHGEVGGDLIIIKEKGKERLSFKQQENLMHNALVLYVPHAQRIKDGTYTINDINELEDCIRRYVGVMEERGGLMQVERDGIAGIKVALASIK